MQHQTSPHPTKEKHTTSQKTQPREVVIEQAYAHDVRTLLEWNAPGRPFKQRTREYFTNSFLIMIALEIILFLFSQYMLMMVIFALVFLSFALAVVPPRTFYYKISSEGVLVENNFFIWEELYDFYFITYHNEQALHIRTKTFFPGELILTLGEISPEEVKAVLLPFLPFREYMEPTFTEKAGNWLERNFPLEKNLR